MVASMDLNVSPVPEDEEDSFEKHVEEFSAPEDRFESAVETARRVLLILSFHAPSNLQWKNECLNYIIHLKQ